MNPVTLKSAPPEEKTSGAGASDWQTLSLVRRRGRRYRRAVYWGIIASVLIHVLMVRLSPLIFRYMEPDVSIYQPPGPIQVRQEGMRALEIAVTEVPPPEQEVQPEPEPEPVEITTPPPPGATEPVLSAAERLRPRVGDWRLWIVSPVRRRVDLTPAERAAEVEARLHALLEAYDDSIAAELARLAEGQEWTVGEDGNKWGVSPGKIHLGPVTLPLPIYFGPGREAEDMLSDYGAIQRQAEEGSIRETQEERIKAMEEARKRELEARRKAQKDTTGTH